MTNQSFKPRNAGSLFLVSAPSGAGKSSLVNALLAKIPGIALSISYDNPRPSSGVKSTDASITSQQLMSSSLPAKEVSS